MVFQKGGERKEMRVEPAKGHKYRAYVDMDRVGDSVELRRWS